MAAAFEVEHTTSISSGILRLLDLALGSPGDASQGLYLHAMARFGQGMKAIEAVGRSLAQLMLLACGRADPAHVA